MARRHYSEEIKRIAIQRYLAGESSYVIAKDLELPYPDLVRKWVESWRKRNGISAENYREVGIGEKVDEMLKLQHIVQEREEERDLALKVLSLAMKGEISGWEELKGFLMNSNLKKN